MHELIEAGYVYIAKPPLYKLTQGKNDRYLEHEAELEEVLLGDKLERFTVLDSQARQFKLTENRWQRFTRLLKQYEGWASALRASHGNDLVNFLEESMLLDGGVTTVEAARELLAREGLEGQTFETSVEGEEENFLIVRAVETRTGLARTHRIRKSLFESEEYRALVRVHAQLVELAGTPRSSSRSRRTIARRRSPSRRCARPCSRSRRRASSSRASRAWAR
jgi:DNA gyrase subunit B